MAQQTDKLTVEAALSAYAAVGPEPMLGELPEEATHWTDALADQELAADQLLPATWLSIECGFREIGLADKLIAQSKTKQRRNRGGIQSRAEATTLSLLGHAYMEFADTLVSRLVDTEDAPYYDRAQAGLAYAAIPLLREMQKSGDARKKMHKHKPAYKVGQALAVDTMVNAMDGADLAGDERIFARLLASLVIGNSLVDSEVVVLPVPPRCYEGLPVDQGTHFMLWNYKHNWHMNARISDTPIMSEQLAGTAHGQLYRADAGQFNLDVLRELYAAMTDPRHYVSPESKIAFAAQDTAGYISGLIKRTQIAVLDLPDLSKYGYEPAEVNIDIDPIETPEINFGALTEFNLIEWYRQQVNGRDLNHQEGLQLNHALLEFDNPMVYGRLSVAEQLAINQLRLECAQALAEQYTVPATERVDKTFDALLSVEQAARDSGEIGCMFEAAIEMLKLEIINLNLHGNVTDVSKGKYMGDLAEMLVEMDFEKTHTKDKKMSAGINELSPAILNALLIMAFTTEPGLVAIPSSRRERGIETYPGWDVNVWKIDDGGSLDLHSRKKLRISEAVDRPMRQGDIGIVPASAIRKLAPMFAIASSFRSIAKEDERMRRSQTLIEKWRPKIQPVYDETIGLISA